MLPLVLFLIHSESRLDGLKPNWAVMAGFLRVELGVPEVVVYSCQLARRRVVPPFIRSVLLYHLICSRLLSKSKSWYYFILFTLDLSGLPLLCWELLLGQVDEASSRVPIPPWSWQYRLSSWTVKVVLLRWHVEGVLELS